MRDKITSTDSYRLGSKASLGADDHAQEIPYDERTYFESFYEATSHIMSKECRTIGHISNPEARFHYNAMENAIIRAILRREPPPRGVTVEAWRYLQQRRGLRLLDIGSGTGHWLDFFRDVFLVAEAVGVEITDQMFNYLTKHYKDEPSIKIIQADIAHEESLVEHIGGPVDYISAIGVMFHIVDDRKWQSALGNLASALKPEGLLFVGGDFGSETHNVQFHKTDSFKSWSEHNKSDVKKEVRFNKRVRSLEDWIYTALNCNLAPVDLVRSDNDSTLLTPENDLLVLKHAETNKINNNFNGI